MAPSKAPRGTQTQLNFSSGSRRTSGGTPERSDDDGEDDEAVDDTGSAPGGSVKAKRAARSEMWRFFFKDGPNVQCNACRDKQDEEKRARAVDLRLGEAKGFGLLSGHATTNMRNHMKTRHPEILKKAEESQTKRLGLRLAVLGGRLLRKLKRILRNRGSTRTNPCWSGGLGNEPCTLESIRWRWITWRCRGQVPRRSEISLRQAVSTQRSGPR
jgi:hypothetical protein